MNFVKVNINNEDDNEGGLPDFTTIARPVKVTCSHCNREGMTKIESKTGILQWLMCCIICCICSWWGCVCCCFIPFCYKDLKDCVHRCEHCNKILGRGISQANKK